MYLPTITSPQKKSAFSAIKIACKTKAEQNQISEVRLIPGLKLFHFWEYGPLSQKVESMEFIISYLLQGLHGLAYDNMNPAMVNMYIFHVCNNLELNLKLYSIL